MADPLHAAAWHEDDAAWEFLRQEVRAALRSSDMSLIRRRIGQMLALAEAHFQPGDPRLAASLACQAWQLRDRQPALSTRLFQDALAQWNQALIWLSRQPSHRRLARSSSFHFRLESKHPGTYRERLRLDLSSSLAIGQALTEALKRGSENLVRDAPNETNTGSTDGVARKIATAVDLLRLVDIDRGGFDRIATV